MRIEWSGRAIDYTKEELDKIIEVAKTGDPQTQGKYKDEFEAALRGYFGVKNAFAVANATNALDLIALLSGIKDGDEVIIPGHTFCATAIPFGRQGAKLVWADIDPETRLVSPESIRKNITEKTKAVVVVHLYGMVCEMDEIISICKENDLVLIEDCAQSFGAEYKGKKAGTFGDFAAFSLHAQKNITTLGEGGVLIVKDDETAKLAPGVRHNGLCGFDFEREDYWRPAMGNVELDIEGVWPYNFSLGEVQCALGAMLVKRVDELNNKRIKRALHFINEMKDFPELTFQPEKEYIKNVYHLLPAKYDGSESGSCSHDVIRMLSGEYGIKAIVQFHPLYRYPLFKKMGFGDADCPNSDDFFDNMVSFPFHEWMSDEDFQYMIDSVKEVLTKLRNK